MASCAPSICIFFSTMVQGTHLPYGGPKGAILCTSTTQQDKIREGMKHIYDSNVDGIVSASWEDLQKDYKITLYDPEIFPDKVVEFLKTWNNGNLTPFELEQELKLFQLFFQGPHELDTKMSDFMIKRENEQETYKITVEGVDQKFANQILPFPEDDKLEKELHLEAEKFMSSGCHLKNRVKILTKTLGGPTFVNIEFNKDINKFTLMNNLILRYLMVSPLYPWRFSQAPSISEVSYYLNYGGIPIYTSLTSQYTSVPSGQKEQSPESV